MVVQSDSQGKDNTSWIPNYGASLHVSGEPLNIKQMQHFDGPDQIFTGNGAGLSISGAGSSLFVSPFYSRVLFRLNHLLHVPSVTKNLLIVSQFANDNFVFFEFHSDKCLVKSQGTNKVLLHGGVGPDGLYSFHNVHLFSNSTTRQSPSLLSAASSSIFAALNNVNKVVSDSTSVHLWHTRLGHPNSHIMNLVFKHCNLSLPNKIDSIFYKSCWGGKSHRLPSHESKSVYSPLELIFTDLWGPTHITSHVGYKYYVAFVDAFSRYTWIFPLKAKNETLSVFSDF